MSINLASGIGLYVSLYSWNLNQGIHTNYLLPSLEPGTISFAKQTFAMPRGPNRHRLMFPITTRYTGAPCFHIRTPFYWCSLHSIDGEKHPLCTCHPPSPSLFRLRKWPHPWVSCWDSAHISKPNVTLLALPFCFITNPHASFYQQHSKATEWKDVFTKTPLGWLLFWTKAALNSTAHIGSKEALKPGVYLPKGGTIWSPLQTIPFSYSAGLMKKMVNMFIIKSSFKHLSPCL